MTAPWERQPGEPLRAYRLFTLYRDMPPEERSYLRVTQVLDASRGKKVTRTQPSPYIREIGRKWRWVERALAWDEEVDRRRREAALRAAEEMARRHVALLQNVQLIAAERLHAMKPEELSVNEVLRYLLESMRMERTIVQEEGPWTLLQRSRSSDTS